MRPGALILRRELEGGLEERVEVFLPAVLTIQSNPHPPRYVSILGIRKAKAKPLSVRPAAMAMFDLIELAGFEASRPRRRVEHLSQDPHEAARGLKKIIQERV